MNWEGEGRGSKRNKSRVSLGKGKERVKGLMKKIQRKKRSQKSINGYFKKARGYGLSGIWWEAFKQEGRLVASG
jgi:hypothetical protein